MTDIVAAEIEAPTSAHVPPGDARPAWSRCAASASATARPCRSASRPASSSSPHGGRPRRRGSFRISFCRRRDEVVRRGDLLLSGRLRQRLDVGAYRREPHAHPDRRRDRHRARNADRPAHGPEPLDQGRVRYADRILLAAAAARLSAADDHLARHRRSVEDHAPDDGDVRADRALGAGGRPLGVESSASMRRCRSARRAFSSCARSSCPRRSPKS